MLKKIYISFLLLSLSACQTVKEQTLPLSSQFLQTHSEFLVQRPTWRLSDKAFEQNIGEYKISSAETNWNNSTRTQLSSVEMGLQIEGVVFNDKFLRFLFLDLFNLGKKNQEKYLIQSEHDFSFFMTSKNEDKLHTKCRFFQLDHVVETKINIGNREPQEIRDQQRLAGYLGCEFSSERQKWFLTLNNLESKNPSVKLYAQIGNELINTNLALEPILLSRFLVGQDWQDQRIDLHSFTGLHFQHQDQNWSTVSFDGKYARIWLSHLLSADQQSLMMALSYSLLMYDWLDNEWRH